MFNFKEVLKLAIVLLITALINHVTIAENISSACYYNYIQNEDTVYIYDTIYVYDTIWEYEYVYDTVWVHDTVYVDTYEDELTYMEPIKVTYIHVSHYHYRENKLVTKESNNKKKQKKAKPSKYYNFRIKHRLRKSEPKPKKQPLNANGKLTLNPAAGSFNPTIFTRGVYSIDGYSGLLMHQNTYSDNTDNLLAQELESATKNLVGFEYGVRANYNLFQFGAHTGFGVTNLREQFNYIEIQTFVDSSLTFDTTHYTQMNVEVIKFLDLEHLLQTGDSIYISINDTTYEHKIDTNYFYLHDTTKNHIPRQTINSYRLLEIPLIFTYEFGYAKTSYLLKLGGVNQIHLLSTGKTYDTNRNVVNTKDAMNYTIYNFAIYAGVGFVYDISPKFCFTFDTYFKQALRRINKSYPINLNRKYYGLNMALRYRF